MTLVEKILKLYPELSINDFSPSGGTIEVWGGTDEGEFIKAWNHPTLPRPTQEQLNGVK